MLTLYGDYVLCRGGEIGVGTLIELLGNFHISKQAVRSAVSRMCHSGLLKAKRVKGKSYYSLTKKGQSLLIKGADRIFQRRNASWDESWSIVTYSIPERLRRARDTLRIELSWLGYGPLSEATWISPYDLNEEVQEIVERLKITEYIHVFNAKHQGYSDIKGIVNRCWDLPKIHDKYNRFLDKYRPELNNYLQLQKNGETIPASECFVRRFNLIHEYRRFPFYDPDLPGALLPDYWLRREAAAVFNQYHNLLADKADEYFDSVFKSY
jgi:phenylacetic acid degradation operon negative regulatory protein